MSFRTKLLLVVLLTIFASVSVVAYGVTHYTSVALEEMGRERTEALVVQFKRGFLQRGERIARQGRNIAEADFTEQLAQVLPASHADQSAYVSDSDRPDQGH